MNTKMSITALLIDDDEAFGALLKRTLAHEDHIEVVYVSSIGAGLNYLQGQICDVILLDLSLPDGDGIDLLKQVTATIPHIPVVVITAAEDERLAFNLIGLGAEDYLIKGELNAGGVARAIRSAIERHRLLRELRQQAARLATLADSPKRLSRARDDVSQAIFSANLVAGSLPHLWRRDPDEAQRGMAELEGIASETLHKINGLLLAESGA